jgi:hypothetical protein
MAAPAALCHEPFEEGQRICADHDHNCCPAQPDATAKTCGKCIRGLLHARCNSAVGIVETLGDAVKEYLSQFETAKVRAA